jgi:hypothetical protein
VRADETLIRLRFVTKGEGHDHSASEPWGYWSDGRDLHPFVPSARRVSSRAMLRMRTTASRLRRDAVARVLDLHPAVRAGMAICFRASSLSSSTQLVITHGYRARDPELGEVIAVHVGGR